MPDFGPHRNVLVSVLVHFKAILNRVQASVGQSSSLCSFSLVASEDQERE